MSIVKHKIEKKEYNITKLPVQTSVNLGCDPEFFLRSKKTGKVVGSELLMLNKKPIDAEVGKGFQGKIIVDGVQAEINPAPGTCRAYVANNIIHCFKALKTKLKGTDFTTDFSKTTVEITPEELDKLNEESKKFGCAPSFSNVTGETSVIPVKGEDYHLRSAGGHIHIGCGPKTPKQIKQFVDLMDIVVGNTAVLLDRDPSNVERRKVYGRAGEYRLPKHGIEYRTLSNYWLRGYPLMSLMFGLTKLVNTVMFGLGHWTIKKDKYGYDQYDIWVDDGQEYQAVFFDHADLEAIREAINTNNFDLALENFNKIKPILREILPNQTTECEYAFTQENFAKFDNLVKDGIDKHFPPDMDVVEYWAGLEEAHKGGYNDFIHQAYK